MKYENKRNGQIFEMVSDVDEKCKTVWMRNVETGKEQTITTSTLKRWYKKLDEDVTQEPEVDHIVLTGQEPMVDCSPCPANEETPVSTVYEEPGMEPEAADTEHYRPAAEAYLTALGYELKADKSMPSRLIVKRDGKTCSELYFGKRALKINVRKDRADELAALVGPNTAYYFKVINNYYLPVTLGNIPYTNTAVILDVFG